MLRIPIFELDRTESALEEGKSTDVCDLWVTGTSTELRRKLVTTSGLQSTILIQPSAPCESDQLSDFSLDVIADTIKQRNVQCVIVCYQPGDGIQSPPIEPCSPDEDTNRYRYLLKRICARVERQRHAQDLIRTHMNQIRRDARIAPALMARKISLHGLFYIPESDSFLVYDEATDRFVPIAEARL